MDYSRNLDFKQSDSRIQKFYMHMLNLAEIEIYSAHEVQQLVMFKIHVLNIIIRSLISNSKALNPYNYMYW